ncbi:MAG: Na+/H+ antiporter subunit E [Alphaproteobacteria bacterium]|nr:Na+/H+ antiporter subunit E [Alphaproteobacteria bacterium]
MRLIVLVIFLFAFWLALSGHYTPFLVASGAAISIALAFFVHRLGTDDEESLPIQVLLRTPLYYPWLIKEIVKSAVTVARIILDPRLPISPTMTVLDASQKTTTGVATYGNSITLTPGTVTTDVRARRLTVYALTREGADDLEAGEMDRRVRGFEGTA